MLYYQPVVNGPESGHEYNYLNGGNTSSPMGPSYYSIDSNGWFTDGSMIYDPQQQQSYTEATSGMHWTTVAGPLDHQTSIPSNHHSLVGFGDGNYFDGYGYSWDGGVGGRPSTSYEVKQEPCDAALLQAAANSEHYFQAAQIKQEPLEQTTEIEANNSSGEGHGMKG